MGGSDWIKSAQIRLNPTEIFLSPSPAHAEELLHSRLHQPATRLSDKPTRPIMRRNKKFNISSGFNYVKRV